MKAKELIEILEKMDPETELSLCCGGENCHENHLLDGIKHHDNEGTVVFNLVDKYKIAREVDMEDFINSLDCLDFDWNALSYDERKELLDDFQNTLANDDTYNACYNEDLQALLAEKYPDLYNN